MDFVTKHLTRHHFFRAPHRWFFSLLLSPIHFAEIHYQKRYHLKYAHAKKLFFFDSALLGTVIVLITSTLFWLSYDPSVTALVYLNISQQLNEEAQKNPERISSGSYTTYIVSYANKSDTELRSPAVSLQLPAGFILDSAKPSENFSSSTFTFNLPSLKPGAEGILFFSGWFYGAVDKETTLSARISYTQADKEELETKAVHILTTLRGSSMEATINAPNYIVSQGSHKLTLSLQNRGTHNIELTRVPLILPSGLEIRNTTNTIGNVEDTIWTVKNMDANQQADLDLDISSNIAQNLNEQELSFTPEIIIDSHIFPQTKISHVYTTVHPNLETSAIWSKANLKPGETDSLKIKLKNSGDTALKNLTFSVLLSPELVDLSMLAKINHGFLEKSTFNIDSGYNAGFSSLEVQEEIAINLDIPIRKTPKGGTDLTMRLKPVLNADISANGSSYRFERSFETPSAHIGTLLSLDAESRYFTNEGDQLGRGPLPPRVGEQTKYWVLINISNTSSRVRDLSFSAKIPEYIQWTGRSSVSKGNNLTFNDQNRLVSWSAASLEPYETVGLYIELGLTPTPSQKGSFPILLSDIELNGTDNYISSPLQNFISSVDSSLKNDKKAQGKGVAVR
ncbi:MAG: hypothetical protein HYY51_01155 [Candidatus Magasanikbacteria bacterium]|nr:hypothetical protein [Candidatus Magasanikbacteria bacterium]